MRAHLQNGMTALMYACGVGDINIVETLLASEASLDLQSKVRCAATATQVHQVHENYTEWLHCSYVGYMEWTPRLYF